MAFLAQLGGLAPIVPILAKADTLTCEERESQFLQVFDSVEGLLDTQGEAVRFFDFQEQGEDFLLDPMYDDATPTEDELEQFDDFDALDKEEDEADNEENEADAEELFEEEEEENANGEQVQTTTGTALKQQGGYSARSLPSDSHCPQQSHQSPQSQQSQQSPLSTKHSPRSPSLSPSPSCSLGGQRFHRVEDLDLDCTGYDEHNDQQTPTPAAVDVDTAIIDAEISGETDPADKSETTNNLQKSTSTSTSTSTCASGGDAATCEEGGRDCTPGVFRYPKMRNIFAVICTADASGLRVLPWTTLQIYDANYSDLSRLQDCLFRNGNIQRMIETVDDISIRRGCSRSGIQPVLNCKSAAKPARRHMTTATATAAHAAYTRAPTPAHMNPLRRDRKTFKTMSLFEKVTHRFACLAAALCFLLMANIIGIVLARWFLAASKK